MVVAWEEGTFPRAGSATVPLIPSRRTKMGKEVEGGRQVEGGGNWEISVISPTRLYIGCVAVPLIPSRRKEMEKEVEGGRQVEGGGNWEISVTSPTRLEVDPQLAQAARLTPRPESKDLLFNILHTTSADLAYLKGLSHEIDFKNFDKNLQNLAYLRDAAGF